MNDLSAQLSSGKKIYFASDLHLGVPDHESSLKREKAFVAFLNAAAKDAQEIFIVGDLFDFWFEYKKAVPRGFVRILGKLAELSDAGILIHLFTGNHDMWMFDYLPKELGAQLHKAPIQREWNGHTFYIGHGDGLGPGDRGYKIIKRVFNNSLCQWLFARLHPNLGIGIANYWSRKSRKSSGDHDEKFLGDDEWLLHYCKEVLETAHYDHFVFGHRHLPLDLKVGESSQYVNLGDWISYFTYGVFDGTSLELKEYPKP